MTDYDDMDTVEDDYEAEADQPAEQSFGRWLLETVVLIGIAFLLAQGIKTFIVQPFVIPTGSMIPTIEEKDRVLAEKLSYRFGDEPSQGDIVVFDDPNGQHPALIKRVIATGGQTVEVKEGAVYVDGKKLDEPYLYGKVTDPGPVPTPITLGDDQLWLMGDNRPNSGDSRFFGPRPASSVRGRAFWTYWPLDRFGKLE